MIHSRLSGIHVGPSIRPRPRRPFAIRTRQWILSDEPLPVLVRVGGAIVATIAFGWLVLGPALLWLVVRAFA